MRASWLQPFLDWLALYPATALLVVFLIAFTESLLIVGVLVPGAALMLGIGSLVALGHLEFWSTLGCAIAGAVLGDGISYWIGYFFKDRLRDAWPFRNHPQLLARGERFFVRHGGKSIVFGRFVGPVRAVIPTIAGIFGMTPVRFTIINVTSAIAWAPAYILPGMAIGVALELASQIAARLVTFLLALLVAIWLLTVVVHQLYRWVQPRTAAWISSALVWGQNHPRLGWLARALLDPHRPEVAALSGLAAVFILSAWVFAAFLIRATIGTSIIESDLAVFNVLQNWRTPVGDAVMVSLSMFFDKYVTIPLGLMVLGYLLAIREWRKALYWIGTVAVGMIMASAVKLWVHVPRPTDLYEGVSAFAFPSAHVTTACVILTFFTVMVTGSLRRRRWFPYAMVATVVFGVALSRLYLGAHWLSDVLGGIALALAWVSAVGLTYRQHCVPLKQTWPLVAAACGTIIIAASWHWYKHFDVELRRYIPPMVVRYFDREAWWQSDWQKLPARRVDVRGRPSTPLTIQFAGNLDTLRTVLQQHGWDDPGAFSLKSVLLWFKPDIHIDQLPVLPNVNNQRHESFNMVLDLDHERRLVLRLWAEGEFTGGAAGSLYAGTITQETVVELFHTVRVARAEPDSIHALTAFLPYISELVVQQVKRTEISDPRSPWRWDGSMVLVKSRETIPGSSFNLSDL